MKYLITLYYFFTFDANARSLRSTANKFAQETTQLAMICGLIGIILAGIYFALGKQDASTKFTQAFFGILIIALGPSIVSFIKGLA
ncbi:MAG: hypothetical protein CME62_15025 [Halobacteriovoraceae bacterium]|nr:hypothetical protein [Halobacteriovoraceae bacterium]|tara:strand:- start:8077 stop:8334 length:258 start_codon:yes stop_codon:yes gene_type:complete